MYPRRFAAETPDRLAIILHGTDQHISYLEMEERANQYAHLFRDRGLKRGDCISIFLENNLDYLVIYWGAQRSGLYITPISSRLTAAEAAYIINDNDSKLLFTSALIGKAAETLIAQRVDLIPNVQEIFALGEALAGATELAAARAKFPGTPIPDESAGRHMVYSSGTTGRPKGIRLPLYEDIEASPLPASRGAILARGGETTWPPPHVIYLSPAPLYHTAPLVATTNQHRAGGTVVILPHFEPEIFLQAVEQHHVTSTQMVPTMFVRLLKLPEDTRLKYDLSSLETVVHAAAPCPVPIKHQMMKWWGPIISEYYGGSEGNGSTWITPEEWIEKPGSVGRASWGVLHICDENGNELPAGEDGIVYFEGGLDFQYHNDPKKTAEARHPQHKSWSTLGDIGHVDEDGYLFLTDRKAFMIISGGVNIYPQEAENALITHPKVADAAVFGVPNEDFGEEVKAIVQPLNWHDAGPALADELIAFCREHLSPIKCPRSIDFEKELPRHQNGKLYKKPLRDRYWPAKI